MLQRQENLREHRLMPSSDMPRIRGGRARGQICHAFGALFKASAFAFRSFPLLICLPSAFAPLGNKRHHHLSQSLPFIQGEKRYKILHAHVRWSYLDTPPTSSLGSLAAVH